MALGVLGLVVCLSPELMAGSTVPTALAIALLAPLTAVAAHFAFAHGAPRWREPVLVVACACAAFVALQATPLPIGVVDVLAPDAAATARTAADVVGDSAPASATLSWAPLETRAELLRGLAVLSVLLAAWAASAAGNRREVVRIAAASVLVLATVVVGHAVLDLREPFGLLPPHWNDPPFSGPIANMNALAGVLAAGVPLLLAAGLEARRPTERWPWVTCSVGVALLCVLVASRGGILSLAVGLAVLAVLMRGSASGRRAERTRAIALALALVTILAAAALFVLGETLLAETARPSEKLAIFAQSLDLIPRAPWLGVGRGAFAAAFVRLHGALVRPLFPENVVLQWSIELGLPLGGAALAVLALSLFRSARSARSPSQMGAIAAAASLGVHEQFDFALERVGIAVLGAAILGAAIAPSPTDRAQEPSIPVGRRVPLLGAGLLALTVAGLSAQRVWELSVARLHDALVQAASRRDWERVDVLASTGARAHPSEPIFPLFAGHAAVVRDRDDAPRWLNRAMVLAPRWYEPHHLAARWLAGRGAFEQAWLEVRQVRRLEPSRAAQAGGCAVAAYRRAAAPAVRVLGSDPALLEQLVHCAHPDVAATLDAHLAEQGWTPSLVRRARRLLAAGEADAALAILVRLPQDDDVALALADAHQAAGRPAEAVAVLRARMRGRATGPLLERLARAQAVAGDEEGMRATVQEMIDTGDGTTASHVRALLLLADLELLRGNHGRALAALDDAHAVDPGGPALERILTTAQAIGDGRRVRLARLELCYRDGPTSPHCTAERPLGAVQLQGSP